MKKILSFFLVSLISLLPSNFAACMPFGGDAGFAVRLPEEILFWGNSAEAESTVVEITNTSSGAKDFAITSDSEISLPENIHLLNGLMPNKTFHARILFLEKPSDLNEKRLITVESDGKKISVAVSIYCAVFVQAVTEPAEGLCEVRDGKVQVPISIAIERPDQVDGRQECGLEARLSSGKVRIVAINGRKVDGLPVVNAKVFDELSIFDAGKSGCKNILTIEIDEGAQLPLPLKIKFYPDPVSFGLKSRYPDAPEGSLDFGEVEALAVSGAQINSNRKAVVWNSDIADATQKLEGRVVGYAVFSDYSGYYDTQGYEVFDEATGKLQLHANFRVSADGDFVLARTSFKDRYANSRIDEAWLLDEKGLKKLSVPNGACFMLALEKGIMVIFNDMSYRVMDKRFGKIVSKGRFITRATFDFNPFEIRLCTYKRKIYALTRVSDGKSDKAVMLCFDSKNGRLIWEKTLGLAFDETYFPETDPKIVKSPASEALIIITNSGNGDGFWEDARNHVDCETGECIGAFGKTFEGSARSRLVWFEGNSGGEGGYGVNDSGGKLTIYCRDKILPTGITDAVRGQLVGSDVARRVLLATRNRQLILFDIEKCGIVWERTVPSAFFEVSGEVVTVSEQPSDKDSEYLSLETGKTIVGSVPLADPKPMGRFAVFGFRDGNGLAGVDPVKGVIWERFFSDSDTVSDFDVFPGTNQIVVELESKGQAKKVLHVDGSTGSDLKHPRIPGEIVFNLEQYMFCRLSAYSGYTNEYEDRGIALFDRIERRVVWSEQLLCFGDARLKKLRVLGHDGNRVYLDNITCLDMGVILGNLF